MSIDPQQYRRERIAKWDAPDREFLGRLDSARMPRHLAVIMDGNGRWARERGFRERIHGHRAGIRSVRETTETCAEVGIGALTLYAFSTENWQRPKTEVVALMKLLEEFLVVEREGLMNNEIRLVASGRREDLAAGARRTLEETMRLTRDNTGMTLNLALSYGSRQEILDAVRHLAHRVARGELDPDAIDSETFSQSLYHPELGDPDLLIRTSGEMRISNFLLWQIAYAELYVTPVLWPDFRRRDLLEALAAFQSRERRFGKVL